ncbi:MAG: SDR family NAD(P)-dependent oxidoreductase, partial [Pseudomonadota bacterium]|nr:SDR family NAD(P)-dependent oxidoreductase [Pseudomonadota bacterium]
MNQINLNGRHAVVTGAAQGIGLAIVERLLASGASVSLWDRDDALLKETVSGLGHEDAVHHMAIDVTDAEGVADALKQTERAIGGVDIMINNAGIAGPIAPSWEYPVDAWREVIEVDLNGVFFCCRAVLPGMRERNYGRIVNVASIAGKEGNPNAAAYSAAKAGVIAL